MNVYGNVIEREREKEGHRSLFTARGGMSMLHAHSVLEDLEITGDDDVLEDGAVWNVDLLALGADDDDGALQGDVLAEEDVTGDGEVV